MNPNNLLRIAAENATGGVAVFRAWVRVHETWEGATVWRGDVAVFDIEARGPVSDEARGRVSDSDTRVVYAWEDEVDGERQVFAVTQVDAIQSAAAAVRASLVHLYRQHGKLPDSHS